MALNFNNKPATTAPPGTEVSVVNNQPTTDIVPVEQYDIVADQDRMRRELVGTEEIEKLTQLVKVDDMNTIVTFGSEVANEISKASDVVLNNMNMDKLNESSKLMNTLAKIMGEFDVNEIKEEPKGLKKLFTSAEKQLNKILKKYNTMGAEVDKIYVELKQYENDIQQSNRYLESMFEANKKMYGELMKYIFACDQLDAELTEYIQSLEAEKQATGDSQIQFQIQQMTNAQQMLQQRAQDLRTLDAVAQQSVPMINMMAYSNYNLVRKIESVFIVNLPIFKQGLSQAMLLKQQKIQAQALAALDEKTDQMYRQNAQNVVDMVKQTTVLASNSPIKIETIESVHQIMMQGANDVLAINNDTSKKHAEDRKRLAELKANSDARFGALPMNS